MKLKGSINTKATVFKVTNFSLPYRFLQALTALACMLSLQMGCKAEGLLEIYSNMMMTDPSAKVIEFQNKAAEQNIVTQRRGYLPKLSVNVREAWVYQNIKESGNTAFPAGKGDYDRTRVQAELDQPLYDPTIKPSIEASKARLIQVQSRGERNTEFLTREIVQEYLKLARFKELVSSVDRVIARLESEANSIAKSNDAKIATASDVQNIKLSLAAMKRERNNFDQQLNSSLISLGVGKDALKSASLNSDSLKNFSASPSSQGIEGKFAELTTLRAEMDEYAHQETLEKRRILPVISLYGQYGLYNDGGSIFGGAFAQDIVEVGIVMKWDIFDRGISRSKAREFEYLKLAKEAELQAKQIEHERANNAAKEMLAQSKKSVTEIADLVEQNKVSMINAARAYDAGKETYIGSINAYLTSEAATREWIHAKHAMLMTQVNAKGQANGWNRSLVESVNTLFASSK